MNHHPPGPHLRPTRTAVYRWAAYLAFLTLYVWAYSYLGTLLIESNRNAARGGAQTAYLDAVYDAAAADSEASKKRFYASHFSNLLPHYMTNDVDPLWPWLMQRHAHATPDILFERGKWFNLTISGGMLLLLGLAAARAFSFSGSAAMLLMGGFSIILERSTYFSPDALFYLLVGLAWLCALSLIRQNPLWMHGVMGALLALAYLAKPLIGPIVAAYLLVSLIRSLSIALRPAREDSPDDLWSVQNQWVGLAIMATSFMLIAGPRLSFASEHFGDAFYSSQKYMLWTNSMEEALEFRQRTSSREELKALAPNERPGLRNYVKQNGMEATLRRAWAGAREQVKAGALGRGGWVLGYAFLVFLVVAVIHRWAVLRQSREVWRVRGTSARWMLLFLGLSVTLTLFHSGMGDAIIRNNSMTTALFLPIVITFVWIAERYRRQLQRSSHARLVNHVYLVLTLLPIGWITVKIIQAITAPIA